MAMTRHRWLAGLLPALAAITTPAAAAPSYDACTGTIASLPAVITTQGTFCMKQDLSTSSTTGSAITVHANNVTIDCNGFKLGGLGAGPSTGATGITAQGRLNTMVRDCKIRGFAVGVALDGGGHVVEGNVFEAIRATGLYVEGDGSLVRDNRILDTGPSYSAHVRGMYVVGDVDVVGNTVAGVEATDFGEETAHAFGIFLAGSTGSRVRDNQVRGLLAEGAGGTSAIDTTFSQHVDIRGNFVAGPGLEGITCMSTNSAAIDNHVNGFTTAIGNCTGADNVVVP
jgi:nitrous oxidase accessory protein NosD